MASKELTAKVRIDVSDAERNLSDLLRKIEQVSNGANRASRGYSDVGAKLNKSTNNANRLRIATDSVANSAKKVNRHFGKTSSLLDQAVTKVKRLASAYLGVLGAKAAIATSDTITGTENKLNNLNATYLGDEGYTTTDTGEQVYSQKTLAATQQALDKMYVSSQKVRMGYADMMNNVSKSMTLAGDAFKNNIDNAIRFQEIMGESYALGGASAAEMSSSMYQLMQALGSGTLQGDELRSVREGAPLAYKAIEQFAQGVYDTTDSLKEMGSQGLISADIVVAAMMAAGNEMDTAFQKTEMTFAQAWENIKNTATKAFEPILQQLNDVLNSDVGAGLMQDISSTIVFVANLVSVVIQVFVVVYQYAGTAWAYLQSFFSWFAQNWSWIQYIAIFALSMIAAYLTYVGVTALAAAVQAAIGFLMAHAVMLGWLALIGLIIVYIIYMAQTAGSGCEFIINVGMAVLTAIVAILVAVGIAYLATGTLILSTTTLTIMAIIAVILILVVAIAAYGEEICGAIAAAISVIWNLFIALMVAIISSCVIPITTAWDNFANFFGNILNDPCATIIRTVESMATAVLSVLQNIASAIDSIFGSNLAGAVGNWVSGISSKADDLVAKYGNGSYEQKSDLTDKFNDLIAGAVDKYTWDTDIAYSQGADFGAGLQDKINGAFDSVTGMFDGLNPSSIADSIGNIGNSIGDMGGISLPSITDPSMALNTDDFGDLGNISDAVGGKGGNGGGISGDTSKIADSMDLVEEDLSYLREIAEMEWKKEFTTANITVDMKNYNQIDGDSDLDGIVAKLTDKLYEELNAVAYGVHV